MAECHYCGRRFPKLYKVTGEDIQRKYPLPSMASEVACADCLDKLRSAARLVPQQSGRQVARNLGWMIPVIAFALFSVATMIAIARVQGISEVSVSTQWIGAAATVFGVLFVWGGLKDRYAFTHDLRWSLNSKNVNFALAVFASGIILLILSVGLGIWAL